MATIRILTESDLRAAVALDTDAIDLIGRAFGTLAEGKVSMPPILRLDIPAFNGEVDVKTAYVEGLDGFAMKISPGFFDNPTLGLPSTSGLMVLHNARTGMVEAVLLDNGYLTDVRTAAAGGVAARYLAPETIRCAGVIGAGTQARLQLTALTLVRPVTKAMVWTRNLDKSASFAAEMASALGLSVTISTTAEALVRACDTVICTTPAKSPLVQGGWLRPGLHITAMGSDAEDKNELDPTVLARADRYVCDRKSQTERLGELHHALASGAVGPDFSVTELGDIVVGRASGRQSAEEITVCDLTGTGVQDTAIAVFAYQTALKSGAGLTVET